VRLEVLITHGQLWMRALRQFDGLLKGKEVLGPPGTLQGCGDLVFTVLAVRVAQRAQGERIALPRDDGFADGHPP
jgi:hypothetical protein